MPVQEVAIKDVKIRNYLSLEDVQVSLKKKFNIIIGANGSGKSNFLKFIFSNSFQSLFTSKGAYEPDVFFANEFSINVEYVQQDERYLLNVKTEGGKRRKLVSDGFENIINISKYREDKIVYKDVKAHIGSFVRIEGADKEEVIMETLREVLDFGFLEFYIPAEIPFVTSAGAYSFHHDEGIGTMPFQEGYLTPLVNLMKKEFDKILAELPENETYDQESLARILIKKFESVKRHNEYEFLLKKYTPINDIRLNQTLHIYKIDRKTHIENVVFNFKIDQNWVPWSYLPDGARRMFYIVTELLLSGKKLFLIEEPELGIHPGQLYRILDFLKLQSEKIQLIITTHSPIALDIISPDELDEIIIAKMTKGGTQLRHLTDAQKDKAKVYIKEVGSLSDYWIHSDLEE